MKAFDKVIGYESVKRELIGIADALANGEAYSKLGATPPRGILLYGNPGVGKTLMATALIEASGRPAFTCRKDKPNGDFVNAIKKTFTDAMEAAPSIVFLDDMDKFTNGDDRHRDAEEYVTVQSCIDEVKGSDVFVLATANRIRVLPDSLLRVGRFDRLIEVENPRGKDAVDIITHYMKNKKFVGGIDPVVVARMMNGHSCAELETVINEAGLYAGFDRSDEITSEHFMKACLHTVHEVPTEVLNSDVPDTDLENGKDTRARIICHEAGHATVAEVLNPGSVTLVSAYCREWSKGGFTSCYRGDGDGSCDEVYDEVCVSLAGMAAQEQKFGEIDVGSSEDLDRAFEKLWLLITKNCVSGLHLHDNMDFTLSASPELTAKQEQAVAAEAEKYFRRAKEILSSNRELFEEIALELSKKGVLNASDIAQIRKKIRVSPIAA